MSLDKSWRSQASASNDGEEGQSDAYQSRLKLKQTVDKLVDEGFSMHIDLPQVVVVGSQSCGKSSLFEGISEVSLPRDKGTCTRCPIICRMSCKPGRWRCKIALMREIQKEENPLPYKERIPFGSDILDEKDVGGRILRAQAAILHPDEDPGIFWKAPDLESLKALLGAPKSDFSFDSILVEIEGPSVKDLSFVDLPGIITNDTDANVEQVKALVTKYVKNEASLILLVYSCHDDISNQGAGTLAKMYDREGRRTIVVLTKPDRIDRGQGEDWFDMLKTSNNCFCVRQPDYQDILNGMSREYARRQEKNFFQTEGWLSLYNDSSTRGRLGTRNLTNYLNVRLFEWIVDRLPQMQDDVRRHLRETRASLTRLPALIEDPVRYADKLLLDFEKGLRDAVDIHNFKIPELVGDCRRRLEKFVDILFYHTYPRFCPLAGARPDGRSHIDLEEFPATESKTSKLSFLNIPIPKTVYLNEIVERSDAGRTRELPRNYSYGILKTYMEASVETWREPTECMLEDMLEYITHALKTLVFEHFGSLKSGLVWEVVKRHIKSRYDVVTKTILTCLKREKTNSQVFGVSEFSRHVDVYLEHYRSQLCAEKGPPSDKHYRSQLCAEKDPPSDGAFFDAVTDLAANVVAAEIGIPPGMIKAGVSLAAKALKTEDSPEGRTTRKLTSQYTPSADEMHAIEVMAQTRAFYHIAVRRYAEGAAQIVFHDLLLDVQDDSKLLQDLREEIGIYGRDPHQRCSEFIQPSKETRRERNDLERKRGLLEEVLSELHVAKERGPFTGLDFNFDIPENRRERSDLESEVSFLEDVLESGSSHRTW